MNILIVRTSAMGDIVHCLPVLRALRRELPEARIGWVVERAFAPLLDGHPDVDELITVRLRPWRKRLLAAPVRREIGAARCALRRFRADVALDLMGNHKGALIARASGAARTVGAVRGDRREASSALWIGEPVPTPGRHAVDRALAVLTALGLAAADPEKVPADFGGAELMAHPPAAAEAFLAGQRDPFVVIQAGAGWGNKTYPAAWWGQVARDLHRQTGLGVLVPTAPGEEHLARGVAAASGGTARSVDAASLPFLAALLRAGRLVLGGDTGPIHLAHALGTPVLCLIGPTDPERNGPYRSPRQVLWRRLPCSCCYKRFPDPRACLLNLPPRDVVDRAREILQGS